MQYPVTFGKYMLLERVNVGGMAEVFKAKTFGVEGFERILAIKRILPNMADDDEFINMFVDEARISVQLSHANIVQIYELGKFDSQYYIAMEYIPGRDLRQLLDRLRKKKQLLPVPATAFVISKVCDGLDYAHRKADPSGRPINVIHRDVSPQNILVSYEGAVKVTDFGIAKAEDRASKTQAGVLKGKFGYMSPEQVRGMEIDRRSDIFAVGILLYEMVTGKRLFIGESDFSTLEKVRNAEVPSPRELNPDISPELETVMMKSLARERDERYQWASELHDDLQQFLIEGTSIFNAKRLALVMKEEFTQEIEVEGQKMEEFMKVSASAEMQHGQEDHQRASPQGDPGWSGTRDNKGERTMIFEAAGGFADAPTQIADADGAGTGGTQTGVGGSPKPTGRGGTKSNPKKPSVSVVATRPKMTGRRTTAAPEGSRSWLLIGLVAVAFVALLLVVILMLASGGDTGTIIVTSRPTNQVDIYLDETLVASQTPFTKSGVAVGEHKLEVKAAGFSDKAYMFVLAADGPAMIQIDLEPGGPPPPSGEGVALVIETAPPGASVRIGDLPQGVTPLTLNNQDPARTVILEISKDGYRTESKPVSFTPQDVQAKRKVVSYSLVAGGKPLATINLDSVPTDAEVSLNNRKIGNTPYKITNLDPDKTYTLSVSKSGYETWNNTVTFNGETEKVLVAKLRTGSEPDDGGGGRDPDGGGRKKDKGKKKDKPPPGGGGTSDGGGGGGKCSGSGAKLSVMAIGGSNCKVMVGKKSLGVAPFFKKSSPTGSCAIKVECDGGKTFSQEMQLKSGGEEKVIIRDAMWK